MIIIGIDCATDPRKVGIARAELKGHQCVLLEASLGREPDSLVETIANWHAAAPTTLFAFDAPLGWPMGLGAALVEHRAGEALAAEPNLLFRRATDRFIRSQTGKRPLDVGADRIARTAHSALRLLAALRKRTGQAIPLAWSPQLEVPSAAIEVYPAATLRTRGIVASGYKKSSQEEERRQIVRSIERWIRIPRAVAPTLEANADVVDAAVCALAGLDFLQGIAFEPPDPEEARREGWIWVADPARI